MANRHLSRSIVLQTLFEWDFTGLALDGAEEILERNTNEFAPGIDDSTFMGELLSGVMAKQPSLDMVIEKAAPAWPIDRISIVDRNVLRMGLFELLSGDRSQVPPKVAINEAIELAKSFGGENSGKFVNGVLGAVYKEIGEPGKEETTGSRPRNQAVDLSTLPIEKLGGAVVHAYDGEILKLALVHDIFGHWTLSKGHLEDTESVEDGTVRKIKEELGIDVVLHGLIGQNEYVASDPVKGKIRKQVSYFLAETAFQELKLKVSTGLDDARWFVLSELPDLNIYDDILPLLTQAIQALVPAVPEEEK